MIYMVYIYIYIQCDISCVFVCVCTRISLEFSKLNFHYPPVEKARPIPEGFVHLLEAVGGTRKILATPTVFWFMTSYNLV